MKLSRGRFIIASVLIVLGVVFLIDNLDVVDVDVDDFIAGWWPAILIVLGVSGLARSRAASMGQIFLIAVGVVLLLMTLDIVDSGLLWPVIIIGIGVWILLGGRAVRRPRTARAPRVEEKDESSIDVSALFSTSDQRVTSQSLRSGKVSATFGSVVLDLGDAEPARDPVLDVEVFMGSVELRVPDEWVVIVNGAPTFGNVEQSRPQPPETDGAPTLTVNASITFGSLEITRAHPT